MAISLKDLEAPAGSGPGMSGRADELAAAESVVRVSGLSKVFKDFWGRPKARAVRRRKAEVPAPTGERTALRARGPAPEEWAPVGRS